MFARGGVDLLRQRTDSHCSLRFAPLTSGGEGGMGEPLSSYGGPGFAILSAAGQGTVSRVVRRICIHPSIPLLSLDCYLQCLFLNKYINK